jgi:hypothetical protein
MKTSLQAAFLEGEKKELSIFIILYILIKSPVPCKNNSSSKEAS